jgi:predicted XRE-type DNA-binding protein
MVVAFVMCMPKVFYASLEGVPIVVDKAVEYVLSDKAFKKNPKKIKKRNQAAARKRAKRLGIHSLIGVEKKIRTDLNERIIVEVKRRKLTHIEVRNITLVPRTKITAIMNRNIKQSTIDLLLRILCCLGVSVKINFN